MKPDKLMHEIKYRNNRIEQLEKELSKLQNEKKDLTEIILKSISFVPNDLADAISYLVRTKEGKKYSPIEGTWFVGSKEMRYLVLCDEKQSVNPNIYLCEPETIKIFFDRYTISQSLSLDYNSLTFEHLLEKYNIDSEQWVRSINFSEFECHPYIKDFISYLAELQIENNGKLLSKKEMRVAVSSFVSIYDIVYAKKSKPKTKELKKD